MAGRGIDGLRVTCCGAVTSAIVRGAQMRAAFKNLARDADIRLTGIVAAGFGATARICRDATRLHDITLMLGRIPVVPDVADHVVNAVDVRRETFSPVTYAHGRRGCSSDVGIRPAKCSPSDDCRA